MAIDPNLHNADGQQQPSGPQEGASGANQEPASGAQFSGASDAADGVSPRELLEMIRKQGQNIEESVRASQAFSDRATELFNRRLDDLEGRLNSPQTPQLDPNLAIHNARQVLVETQDPRQAAAYLEQYDQQLRLQQTQGQVQNLQQQQQEQAARDATRQAEREAADIAKDFGLDPTDERLPQITGSNPGEYTKAAASIATTDVTTDLTKRLDAMEAKHAQELQDKEDAYQQLLEDAGVMDQRGQRQAAAPPAGGIAELRAEFDERMAKIEPGNMREGADLFQEFRERGLDV